MVVPLENVIVVLYILNRETSGIKCNNTFIIYNNVMNRNEIIGELESIMKHGELGGELGI